MNLSKTFIKRTLKSVTDTVDVLASNYIKSYNVFGGLYKYNTNKLFKITSVIQKESKGRVVTDILNIPLEDGYEFVDHDVDVRNNKGLLTVLFKVNNQYKVMWYSVTREGDELFDVVGETIDYPNIPIMENDQVTVVGTLRKSQYGIDPVINIVHELQ